jgi:hypothetical protein
MGDFYTSDVELTKIQSEMIEPFANRLISRWFNRCTQALEVKQNIEKKLKDEGREPTLHEYLDMEMFFKECQNMWWGLDSLSSLAIACKDSVHFCIALQNEQRKIGEWIEEHLGFNPISTPKNEAFGF